MSNNFIPDPKSVAGEPLDLAQQVAKLPGMEQERHHNMIGEVAKQLGVKPEDTPDLVRLWAEASRRRKVCIAHASEVDDLARNSTAWTFEQGTQMLGEEVCRRVVEQFHTFSREELLFILARWMTENIVGEFR